MAQAYKAVEGTAKELIARGTKINGRCVDTVDLSVMARLGVIKVTGKETRAVPTVGRIGSIYRLQGKPGFNVE